MNIVGIDLGTTFSAISALNTIGKPEIVPNSDGERLTPSVVSFKSKENVLVGVDALNSYELYKDTTIRWIKKYMGEDSVPMKIFDKPMSPALLSSLILKKIKDDFEDSMGPIDYAVITVPAYFDEIRRRATLEAGKLAGINVIGLVNEPTSAAIYYAYDNKLSGRYLVYDLGGGTFDITIIEISGENVEIIASGGDHQLGGYDFDRAIMEEMLKEYRAKYEIEDDEEFFKDIGLQQEAEGIKKQLSKSEKTKKTLVFKGNVFDIVISRSEYEALISASMARIDMMVELLLEDAQMDISDISEILLVGGSTRMPMVKRSLKDIFGREPMTIGNVDECVALGASIYCGMQALKEDDQRISNVIRSELNSIAVQEVCNHSYGTSVLSIDEYTKKPILMNDIIIPKNSKIPISIEKIFYTIHDNQTTISIDVTQGEGRDIDMVNKIASEEMSLPPNRPANRPVKTIYSYDSNQVMSCKFVDVESGYEKSIELSMHTLDARGNSNDEDIMQLFNVE